MNLYFNDILLYLLKVVLEEAKSVQQKLKIENSNLEDKVKKYELRMETAQLIESSASNAPLLHALEQEVCCGIAIEPQHCFTLMAPSPSLPPSLKKKDKQIAEYEDKITHLIKEVETLKKLSEKVHNP